MKLPKYIIVKIGQLADGKGSGAYQLAERCGEAPVYETTNVCQNDPVTLRTALRRLEALESGEISA